MQPLLKRTALQQTIVHTLSNTAETPVVTAFGLANGSCPDRVFYHAKTKILEVNNIG